LELQKNGKIHAHLTFDVFVHWRVLRTIWNRVLNNNGLLSDFERAHGHRDPNSTDVHSVAKVKDVAAYMAKYMAKNQKNMEGIKGRIWSCSYELSRANKTSVHVPAPECAQELRCLMSTKIDFKELIIENPVTKIMKKFGEIMYISSKNWREDIVGVVKETYVNTINSLRSFDQFFTHKEFYV
jgi:hypothetical protein